MAGKAIRVRFRLLKSDRACAFKEASSRVRKQVPMDVPASG
jgi:hypothetical protein